MFSRGLVYHAFACLFSKAETQSILVVRRLATRELRDDARQMDRFRGKRNRGIARAGFGRGALPWSVAVGVRGRRSLGRDFNYRFISWFIFWFRFGSATAS